MKSKKHPKKKSFHTAFMLLSAAAVLVLIGIYSTTSHQQKSFDMANVASYIAKDNTVGSAASVIIDEGKLESLQYMDYSEFKKIVNANRDLCLYIQDARGKIIFAKAAPQLQRDGICNF